MLVVYVSVAGKPTLEITPENDHDVQTLQEIQSSFHSLVEIHIDQRNSPNDKLVISGYDYSH